MKRPLKNTGFWLVLLVVIPAVILLALESVSSIAYYQRTKRPELPRSSTAAAIRKFLDRSRKSADTSETGRFDFVMNLRAKGNRVYPAYLYEPQLHHPSSPYHLANPISSEIVYRNEGGFYVRFNTDEIGFRNPPKQIGTTVDYTFLGDSFTEGAYENEDGTMAGHFRNSGKKVLNLGKGGSGPLFQMAILREYGAAVKSKKVVWYIFTGNDFQNLREEKTTALSRYLDPAYTQGLFAKREEISELLTAFIDSEIVRNTSRKDKGKRFPTMLGYGETLDPIEAKEKEAPLFLEIAGQVNDWCRLNGSELRIVILNHVVYDYDVQDITSQTVRDFAKSNGLQYLEFTREELLNRKDWYTGIGTHFNAIGYRAVADRVMKWLSQ